MIQGSRSAADIRLPCTTCPSYHGDGFILAVLLKKKKKTQKKPTRRINSLVTLNASWSNVGTELTIHFVSIMSSKQYK